MIFEYTTQFSSTNLIQRNLGWKKHDDHQSLRQQQQHSSSQMRRCLTILSVGLLNLAVLV